MYSQTIKYCAKNAARINKLIKEPLSFYISSAMAGAYVGLAMILIFTIGNTLDKSIQLSIMGATFGIALTLVIIAGSELFTGHTMYMTFAYKTKTLDIKQIVNILPQTWLGNLIGSIAVAILYKLAHTNLLDEGSLVHIISLKKVSGSALALFAKGALCNYFVCLSIWMCMRVEGYASKFIAIWWCLLAFIASGYEHSVANMTLLTLSYIGEHSEAFTFGGIVHNLFWVTLGNLFSGVVFMGLGYWYATPKSEREQIETQQ